MERRRLQETKQLCGLFGGQLYEGEIQIVKRKKIMRKHPTENIMQPARGFLEPAKGEIHILQHTPIDEQIITVLHELFHFDFPQIPEEDVETRGIELFHSLNLRQKKFFETMLTLEPIENK